MKTLMIRALLITVFLSGIRASAQEQTFTMTTTELKTISNEKMRHSDQIRFSFGNTIHAEHSINEDENSCTLSFFNLPFSNSQAASLAKKIKGSSAIISGVAITKLTDNNSKIDGTQIKINFSGKNIHINMQVFENPHQLVIDITSMNRLFSKIRQNNVISLAFGAKQNALFMAQMLA